MAIKNSNYSILVDVDLNVKGVQAKLDKMAKEQLKPVKIPVEIGGTEDIKKITKEADNASKGMKDLKDSAEDTSLTFQAANEIFRRTIDVISSMVEQVYKLDAVQIEFQKVSDLSGEALDNYISKLSDMGGAVARTGSEMLEASTEFRKNGFNDEDAAQLGQIAAMFQNVADEEISAGNAASFIIAQMTAFDIGADNAVHIIDAVNEVANKFSVSSADISNNLGKMSAVMGQTGASFEQGLAMLTAITEVTRSASKASRGLVSIGSRLVEVLNENSSTGNNLRKIYEELGIQLFDTEGQLRSSYDIFYDLAQIWDTLDRNTQNYISTEQAGEQKCPFKVNCWKTVKSYILQHKNEICLNANV